MLLCDLQVLANSQYQPHWIEWFEKDCPGEDVIEYLNRSGKKQLFLAHPIFNNCRLRNYGNSITIWEHRRRLDAGLSAFQDVLPHVPFKWPENTTISTPSVTSTWRKQSGPARIYLYTDEALAQCITHFKALSDNYYGAMVNWTVIVLKAMLKRKIDGKGMCGFLHFQLLDTSTSGKLTYFIRRQISFHHWTY